MRPVPNEANAFAEDLLAERLIVQNVLAEPPPGQGLSGQSAGADRIFATFCGRRSRRMAGAGIFADMPTARTMATRDAVLESWQDAARKGSNIRDPVYIPREWCATHPASGAQRLDRWQRLVPSRACSTVFASDCPSGDN